MAAANKPRFVSQLGLLIGASVAVLSVALLALAYMGWFTRYLADDYCFTSVLRSLGFFGAQVFRYKVTGGRVTFTLLQSIAGLVGPGVPRLLPLIALLIWIPVIVWTVSRVTSLYGGTPWWPASLLLGELVIFATLDGSPSIAQIFYFQNGMLTYLAPLITLTGYVGLVAYWGEGKPRIDRSTRWLLFGGALTFFAAGCSETVALVEAGALVLAIVLDGAASRTRPARSLLPMLAAGLVGSLLGVAVEWASPGNAIRLRDDYHLLRPRISLADAGTVVFLGLQLVRDLVWQSRLTTMLAVLVPALLARELAAPQQAAGRPCPNGSGLRRTVSLLALLLFSGFVLILLVVAPHFSVSEHLQNKLPPGRTQTIAEFVLVCVAVACGYLVGSAAGALAPSSARKPFHDALAILVLITLLAVGPVRHTLRSLAGVPEMRAYAAMWDARDREIREAALKGKARLQISALGHTGGIDDVGPNPRFWVNRCFAAFYGVESVVAGP